MFASNGSTSETSISTPATGHASAWKNAAIVTIIAATLPRNSKGLGDIASTADIVEKSSSPEENRVVTVSREEEAYAILLWTTSRE
jgi:hypothetical protein